MRYSLRSRRCLAVFGAAALVLLVNSLLIHAQIGEYMDEEEIDEYQFARSRQSGKPPSLSSSPNTTACSASSPSTPRQPWQPTADAQSVVTIGGVMRFTVLTERVIRIEHRGGSDSATAALPFDDRASFAIVNRRLRVPAFTVELGRCQLLDGRCLIIETALLRLEQAAPINATGLRRDQRGIGQGAAWTGAWPPPRPTKESLRARIRLQPWPGGSADTVEWYPGKPNPGQLPGTIRTLEQGAGDPTHGLVPSCPRPPLCTCHAGPNAFLCAHGPGSGTTGAAELRCAELPDSMKRGMKDDAHCAMGLISRDGWTVLDDTTTARYSDAGPRASWAWAESHDPEQVAADRAAVATDGDERCAGWARSGECVSNRPFMESACKAACAREAYRQARAAAETAGNAVRRLDIYLFGAGLDYKAALGDYAVLSGEQPLPPRYAFGVWFSRWWPYADWESAALLREFDERGVPADVLITDMDWHHTYLRGGSNSGLASPVPRAHSSSV